MEWSSILVIAAAYVIGSIPTGLWLGRRAGVDVRAGGSGNIGATNVARTAGWRLGVLTLVIDAAKGAVPVLVAWVLGLGPWVSALAGLGAFYGHIFSLFAGFHGGKGVATAAGAFAALAPVPLVGAIAVFALVAWRWRIVSLASLAAGVALPMCALLLGAGSPIVSAATIAAMTIALTHRDNIRRLAAGTEPTFQGGVGD